MGKRSDFEREPRDLYRTWDRRATDALAPFLPPLTQFVEPCAGAGDLIGLLEALGHHCVGSCDIMPLVPWIAPGDALKLSRLPAGADMIITNPPWRRDLLHALIERFLKLGRAWLLFDADWMHTAQAGPLLSSCSHIVSIGRIRWIPGTGADGKDNCAWHHFAPGYAGPIHFHGRAAS